jgi:prephenate dehydrogenase (NADP+)
VSIPVCGNNARAGPHRPNGGGQLSCRRCNHQVIISTMANPSADYYATLPINVTPNASPSLLPKDQPTIGLIGMGAMGQMYATCLGQAGWRRYVQIHVKKILQPFEGISRIHVCDRPEKFDQLKLDYAGRLVFFVPCTDAISATQHTDSPNIYPMRDGHGVSRSSDFIVYSVEAEFIEQVVAQYGPCKQIFSS